MASRKGPRLTPYWRASAGSLSLDPGRSSPDTMGVVQPIEKLLRKRAFRPFRRNTVDILAIYVEFRPVFSAVNRKVSTYWKLPAFAPAVRRGLPNGVFRLASLDSAVRGGPP